MNPKNSTRIDFKIKNSTTGKLLWARERVFPQFMLSCPFRIFLWKLICKIFKILTKIWRWNHSKRMSHVFLINFSISVFSYANCSTQICTLILKYLSFFFYWLFWADSFFCLFCNTSNLHNLDNQKFPMSDVPAGSSGMMTWTREG